MALGALLKYSPAMPGDEQEPSPPASPWRLFIRKATPALKLLGLVLFAMAIWRAAVGVEWTDVFKQNPLWLLGIIGAILLNFALSTLLIYRITLTFKPQPVITYFEMVRLILASSLLNYAGYVVPVGMVFRAGYLKTAHNVPLTASAKTAVLMLALTALVALGIVSTLVLPGQMGMILALMGWGACAMTIQRVWARFAPDPAAGRPWTWVSIRIAELLTQGLRVWLSFKAVGAQITPEQAVVIGAVTVLVGLASGMPSGLGVREWAMGLSGAWLQVAAGPVGLAAALVDRACEVVIYLAFGGPALAGLKRKNIPQNSEPNDLPR